MPASVLGPRNDPGGGEQSEVLAATNRGDLKKHVIQRRGGKCWTRFAISGRSTNFRPEVRVQIPAELLVSVV